MIVTWKIMLTWQLLQKSWSSKSRSWRRNNSVNSARGLRIRWLGSTEATSTSILSTMRGVFTSNSRTKLFHSLRLLYLGVSFILRRATVSLLREMAEHMEYMEKTSLKLYSIMILRSSIHTHRCWVNKTHKFVNRITRLFRAQMSSAKIQATKEPSLLNPEMKVLCEKRKL